MSERIVSVLATLPQSFTTAEQKIGRDNIGAQKSISYSYSGSTITAIDGSAVVQPDALTKVVHDSNLSGSGTTGSPLGLTDHIELSSTSNTAKTASYDFDGVVFTDTTDGSAKICSMFGSGIDCHTRTEDDHWNTLSGAASGLKASLSSDRYVTQLAGSGVVSYDGWSPGYYRAEWTYRSAVQSGTAASSVWTQNGVDFVNSASSASSTLAYDKLRFTLSDGTYADLSKSSIDAINAIYSWATSQGMPPI